MTAGGSRQALRSRATRGGAVIATTLAMAAAVLAAPPARAAVVRVASPTGSGMACTAAAPCTVVQAFANALSGDTVALSPGTYVVGQDLDVEAFTVQPLVVGTRPVLQFTGDHRLRAWQPASVVSDLRIEALNLFPSTAAVLIRNGIGRRLEVVADSPNSAKGVDVRNAGALVDSTVWSRSEFGSAITMGDGGGLIRNVTALATGPDSTGLFTSASYMLPGSTTMTFAVQNSILRGSGHDLHVHSGEPTKVIIANLDHSNYATVAPTGTHAVLNDLGGRQTAAPAFVAPADGNFRQLATSPTRNAGAPVGGLSATALDGQARIQESAPDIGADEFAISAVTSGVLKRNKRKGTATWILTASAAGQLVVTGRKVKGLTVVLGGPGATMVKIKPTRAGKKTLNRKGKLRTRLTVTWLPSVGVGTAPAPMKVVLKKRKR
ncbi:hypothetical protein RB608_27240 [Nocardioides sp. LHD-245]|uniref:hypothetical protein n=1 Tax=Nocardioides sp. LHD-245 TaxID=3051387 RepID=UPI0027DEFA10|nr:hypothetical protein [Nocardioides sp. LHD-245]